MLVVDGDDWAHLVSHPEGTSNLEFAKDAILLRSVRCMQDASRAHDETLARGCGRG